jgi:ABC-type transport system involved in cytochrome c biogenesis permease subunit
MTCEACGIENPASAKRCDCGHVLGVGVIMKTHEQTALMRGLDVISRLLFLLPLASAAWACFYLSVNWDAQKGAPQQAALAAYTLAWAVIPYCFAGAFAGLAGRR